MIDHEDSNFIYDNVDKNKTNVINYHYITINSIDRNIYNNYNPFEYQIYFSSGKFDNDVSNYIPRDFKNIKSIELISGILPKKYNFNRSTGVLPDEISVVDQTLLDNTDKIENVKISASGYNYVIINAIRLKNEQISFTISNDNLNYTFIYNYNNFNKNDRYVTDPNEYINDDILYFLNSRNYDTNTTKTFSINIKNEIINVDLTINSITTSTKIIFNYCLELNYDYELINNIYYFEDDGTNQIRYIYTINNKSLINNKYNILKINEVSNYEYSTNLHTQDIF
jgi:hypothetical protein